MSGHDWDERYSGPDPVWSGRPNGSLLVEVASLAPGTALDVGCGEGADAVWLAQQGWQVTGVDVAQPALDRAARAAADANVRVEWVCSRLEDFTVPGDGYDLVSLHYAALRRRPGDDAVRALLAAVGPGGTLLVVGHARIDPDVVRAHGFDVEDFVQPGDIAAVLGEGWDVEVDEERPRVDAPPGAEHTFDLVLRARRSG